MYGIAGTNQYDADFRLQLHFNFSATRSTQEKQFLEATHASRLHNVDLDAVQDNSSSVLSNK